MRQKIQYSLALEPVDQGETDSVRKVLQIGLSANP
jgi:hypothetical protein